MTDFSRLWKKWRNGGHVTTIDRATEVIGIRNVIDCADSRAFMGFKEGQTQKIVYAEHKTLVRVRKEIDKGRDAYLMYLNGFSVDRLTGIFEKMYPPGKVPPVVTSCDPGFSNPWWKEKETTWTTVRYPRGYYVVYTEAACHDNDPEDQKDRVRIQVKKRKIDLAVAPAAMGIEVSFLLHGIRGKRILAEELCRGTERSTTGNAIHYGYHDERGMSVLGSTYQRLATGALLYVPWSVDRT